MDRYQKCSCVLLASIILAELFLVAMYVMFNQEPIGHAKLAGLFHLGEEENLPTWFSSTQFLLLGLVLAAIFVMSKAINPHQRTTIIWLFCSMGAVFLSADETATLHENFGSAFRQFVDRFPPNSMIANLSDFPSYFWILLYVPIALPVAVILSCFLWKELGRLRLLPIAGMVLFLIGAVGVDYIEGIFRLTSSGPDSYFYFYLVEESLEMFGVTLILAGCLLHTAKLVPQWIESLKSS